ncbi:MAG TPA: tRNA uridine-5-carboxymethylaminomethyl(34) synthesis GTPase MnmE [bacterium]
MSDTIAAIATGAGCGIGIVRISGPEALAVGSRVFRGRGGRALDAAPPLRLILGTVVDPESRRQIDEAFAVRMRAGGSYTGEPTVELQCHGGRATLDAVLRAVIDAGARLAAPGEFTKRAYLAGRIDLSQAEAVAELIAARTDAARQAALSRLHGGLGERVRAIAGRLLEEIAAAEVLLDHGDEDVASAGPDAATIRSLAAELREVAALGQGRDEYTGARRVVIAGRTNSGKSSLFNMLCSRERSIVSPEPGTTRDYIEERLPMEGALVTLVDTAGMRETRSPVEREGIKRGRQQMVDADLLILTVDAAAPLAADDLALIEQFRAGTPLVVLTKSDLPMGFDRRDLELACPGLPIFSLSTLDRGSCADLTRAVAERCRERSQDGDAAAPNLRHRESLRAAAGAAERAAGLLADDAGTLDQVAAELRWATASLGAITGETAGEEIVDRIFSRFCIGK